MPRLTNITLALATLFASAAMISAQNAYPAGQRNSNEALQYQDQYGQKASPYDYGNTSNGSTAPTTQAYAAPDQQAYAPQGGQPYADPNAQPAPAYGNGDVYAQPVPSQAPVPAVDSGLEYPAPAVVAYPYPYPYYPYGYYPYYGGIRIGLGFGYHGGYRGGYYPRGYVGGFRGGYVGGFHGSVGSGFHGGAAHFGGGRR